MVGFGLRDGQEWCAWSAPAAGTALARYENDRALGRPAKTQALNADRFKFMGAASYHSIVSPS